MNAAAALGSAHSIFVSSYFELLLIGLPYRSMKQLY